MTEGTSRPGTRGVLRAVLATLTGMLAGAALNAALGDQGADTPALALLGGALALSVVLVGAGPTPQRVRSDNAERRHGARARGA